MNPKFISMGIAGALIYLAWSGKIKNATVKTAAVSLGVGVLVKQVPGVNQYLG